jgi:hypothetical protein
MEKYVFISHSHEDKVHAQQIKASLNAAGIDVWVDANVMNPGDGILLSVAAAIKEADYFIIIVNQSSCEKPWVRAEMEMALDWEIKTKKPKVIPLLFDDSEMPDPMSRKLYLDFRGRYDEAVNNLSKAILGKAPVPEPPKQKTLSLIIREADKDQWQLISRGSGEWSRSEAAQEIQTMPSNELDAAISIASIWENEYKWFDDAVLQNIRKELKIGEAAAMKIIRQLVGRGLLIEATDLDYAKLRQMAYCDTDLLRILKRTVEIAEKLSLGQFARKKNNIIENK